MDDRDIQLKVEQGLVGLEPVRRQMVKRCLIHPYLEMRKSHDSTLPMRKVWIIAVLPDHGVCLGYAEGGYENDRLEWGLLFSQRLVMGDSGAWYQELSGLLEDCGYF